MSVTQFLLFAAILLLGIALFIALKRKAKKKGVAPVNENAVDLFFRHIDDL